MAAKEALWKPKDEDEEDDEDEGDEALKIIRLRNQVPRETKL